jgi:hypothetical protein
VHRYCDPFKRRQICAGRLWRCEDSLRIALRCHLSKGMFLFHVSALRLSETFSAPHPPTSHCQCQQPLRRYTARMCLRLGVLQFLPRLPTTGRCNRPLKDLEVLGIWNLSGCFPASARSRPQSTTRALKRISFHNLHKTNKKLIGVGRT